MDYRHKLIIDDCGIEVSSSYYAYRFWLYQYSYRNKKCSVDTKKLMKLCFEALIKKISYLDVMFKSSDSVLDDYAEDFEKYQVASKLRLSTKEYMEKYEICPYVPLYNSCGLDSSKLLLQLQSCKKLYMQFYDTFYHKTIKNIVKDVGNNTMTFSIDLNYGYNEIISDISIFIEGMLCGKDSDNMYEVSARKFKDKIAKISLNSNIARTIGVWMWDRISSEYGDNKLPYGAIARTIRRLKSDFDIDKLGYSASPDRTMANMYYKTCRCIKDRKVYQI